MGAQGEHGWSPAQLKHSLASLLGRAKLQGTPHNFLKSGKKRGGEGRREEGRREEGRGGEKRGGEERGGEEGEGREGRKGGKGRRGERRRVLLSSNYRS